MIISDLNHLEVIAAANIEGGTYPTNSYTETNLVSSTFNWYNNYNTSVNSPKTYSNSAAASAKGEATNPYGPYFPTYSYTKADTLAVTSIGGGSLSVSGSVAVINPV